LPVVLVLKECCVNFWKPKAFQRLWNHPHQSLYKTFGVCGLPV
jgi:hypothetical protein